MTLQAHTQQNGTYDKYESFGEDVYTNVLTGRVERYPKHGRVAQSFKQFYPGDGFHPTRYSRTVRTLVDHTPRQWQYRRWRSDGTLESGEDVSLATFSDIDIDYRFPDIQNIRDNAWHGANVKALNDLRSDNKQQLFVDLVESRKTFNMLRGAAIDTFNALRQLRRLDIGGATSTLLRGSRGGGLGFTKHLGNRYLEWRYGWKPVISSIYGLQELLKEDWAAKTTIRGKGFFPFEYESFVPYWDGGGVDCRSRGGFKTVYTGTMERGGLVNADNLGMLNPVSAAWELVPFSFVVDWFVPVGDVLEAYSATAGLSDVYGYTSEWEDQTRSVELGSVMGRDYNLIQPGGHTQKLYNFRRHVHGVRPAQLYGEPNAFSGKKQSRGWAAAALIRQLWK